MMTRTGEFLFHMIGNAEVTFGILVVVEHLNCSSSQYDALLVAEASAEKEKKGLFADKKDGERDEKKVVPNCCLLQVRCTRSACKNCREICSEASSSCPTSREDTHGEL